jgi:hypothetical protein
MGEKSTNLVALSAIDINVLQSDATWARASLSDSAT